MGVADLDGGGGDEGGGVAARGGRAEAALVVSSGRAAVGVARVGVSGRGRVRGKREERDEGGLDEHRERGVGR